ncbi:hypothetical protein AAAV51_08910 [Agathobaculum butyriciproducens]|uniref:Sodium:solute symporter family protein n=1 Tax=Agathobaculum butyriciproducens TaxID=1628085 RepID=A0AAW4VWM1_9FIRM|nr:hypothetical protein [Agathobaculum butyriciproducens]
MAGSLLALFAAPRYLKSGITTIPQLLGERYDKPTKLWFSIAYIILYLFVQILVILYSGSLVFENIFNLSGILGITKFQSIIILCILITIIGSIYAIFGGLKAVAVSDTINGVGLLIGGLMIPFLALNVLGHASGSENSVAYPLRLMYHQFKRVRQPKQENLEVIYYGTEKMRLHRYPLHRAGLARPFPGCKERRL